MSIHILEALARNGFEEVLAVHDRRSGLRAFLAVHDTRLGPAFGGVRRWGYLDEEQALRDCMRLARSMTWKCAMAEVGAGGAKLVILDQPELDVPSAYRFIGKIVERMNGRFYTGPDVGTGTEELGHIAEHTSFVTHPGSEGPGELPDATSAGVVAGMAAALRHLDGDERWSERVVVVQGLGAVGSRVARALSRLGARVIAAESNAERAEAMGEELGIELIDPSSEFDPECDVFAPCALGGILHDLSLTRLRCRVIVGGANNVLASSGHGDRLHESGILYVPDFVVNSGALIRGAKFHLEGVREPVERIGERIGETVGQVLRMSAEEDAPPERVAVREAERRIEARRDAVP